ncbi:hypothetical protein F2Q70_00005704 [Brassica cretica]|uniref:Aspartic peptidase DDI1-type domain-containing protein n=1 Tax=Brassica cretica TaxID=69181 RepID=A0A8S9IJ33_BRACR|nr:hypothetical protein F2Q70_00005704 [Brassica cretica]
MEQATARKIQNQNQRQPQSNRQAVSATGNSQPNELKGLGAEERTEHSASSKVTAPDELAETPPVRVYVPKVPYRIPPKHLMDPISAEQLAGFTKMVRRLPEKISYEHAWEIWPLHMFFKHCRETREEIKALFTEALTPSLKVLPKVDDPGKFVFPSFIAGVEFKEALCDSGSSVNLVSKAILDELGIVDVEPSLVDDPGKFVFPCSIAGVEFKEALCDSGSSVNLVSKVIVDELDIVDVAPSMVTLPFSNSSMTIPYGTICNLPVQVGNCVLHTEFQVAEMSKDHEMLLIFGRSFMATVGAVIDMPNKRVSFSNINKKVFYKAVPTISQIRYASCISVVSGEQLEIVAKKELGKKGAIREVLDGDPHTDTKKLTGNAKMKEKVQKKRVKGDPMMSLIPRLCDEKSIEYEVKCKGTSKPLSKVRVILTHELKEKGEAAVKGLLSRVLKLNISDCGACFGTSPHAQPA